MTDPTNPTPTSRFDRTIAADFQELALVQLLKNPELRGVVVVFDYNNGLNVTDTITGIWQTRKQNEKAPSELFGGIAQTTKMLEGMVANVETMVNNARDRLQLLLTETRNRITTTNDTSATIDESGEGAQRGISAGTSE